MQAIQEKPATTVRLETNEKNLFRNLGVVFTDKKKVLSELIQNSRRAGATEIQFSMSDDILTITDNGKGIDNFQKLLTCAESGWSEGTMESENPFGMGWLSTLYSADQVIVDSHGQRCCLDTKSVLEMNDVTIENSINTGFTSITLIGFKLDLKDTRIALGNACRGFPIPVFFNGEELERPHAIQNLSDVIECKVGTIKLSTASISPRSFILYYQGLPVAVPDKLNHYESHRNILHLDSRFKVRMPDRDTLIDADEIAKECNTELEALWRQKLIHLKQTKLPADFAKFFAAMKEFKCLDLLNDVEVLPSCIVKQVVDYPHDITYTCDQFLANAESEITKTMVEQEKVFVIQNIDQSPDGNEGYAFAILTAIMGSKEWLVLEDSLHPEHWIYKHAIDADSADVKIFRTPIKKGSLEGRFVDAMIEIVESYDIQFCTHTFKGMTEPIGFGVDSDEGATIILSASKLNSQRALLGQMNNFHGEFGYEEQAEEDDCAEFQRVVDILAGQKSFVTIQQALHSASIASRDNCLDTANVVFVGKKYDCPKCVSLENVLADFVSKHGSQLDAQTIKSYVEGLIANSGSNLI